MARYAIETAHVQFFREHGFVEFEALLDQEQTIALRKAMLSSLAGRAGCEPYELDSRSNDALLKLGRDVSKGHEALQRTVRSKRLAEVAAALSSAEVLRVAFDQAFVSGRQFQTQYLSAASSLDELSSCQGQLCALLLNIGEELGDPEERSAAPVPTEGADAANIFTQVPGNGVLISPQLSINWELLLHRTDACYLLISYVGPKGRYLKNAKDWGASQWIDAGYASGDHLDPRLHPRVWNSA